MQDKYRGAKILSIDTLSGRTSNVVTSHAAEIVRSISEQNRGCIDLYVLCASGAQGALLGEEWWVTASQLDLPSLTPLSVAGLGRLQLGAAHCATSVTSLQVVHNCINCVS